MLKRVRPKQTLSAGDLEHGIRMVTLDGVTTQIMATLVTGPFLVAFALVLGASLKVIGLLAAIGPLSQLLQLPTIFLINRLRWRKALALATALPARLSYVAIAVIPWLVPAQHRVTMLLACLVTAAALGNVAGCAWNSWMRDLLPDDRLGHIFGRRLAIATAISAFLALGAGAAVDRLQAAADPATVYSGVFLVGAAAGLTGLGFLAGIPEPAMPAPTPRPLHDIVAAPLRDRNFRNLVRFLGAWNFAVNLAAPFYTVYMLDRLGLGIGTVVALSVVSQLANAYFLRLWGRLSDRYSNKSVLNVSGAFFLVTFLLWPFSNLPNAEGLTIPLVLAIHILAGISTAGVTLCSGNIALKAAPRGEATAYLATNAIWSGIAATVAPIIAGIASDWFRTQRVRLNLSWTSTANGVDWATLTPLDLRGLDFLFLLAFVLGLYAMHRLLAVSEAGEVERGVVVSEFYSEVRRVVRSASSVAGLRHLTAFPYAVLLYMLPERRRERRTAGSATRPPDQKIGRPSDEVAAPG